MKPLCILLAVLFGFLQYKLWIEKNGIFSIHQLQKQLDDQMVENKRLSERNELLAQRIKELKEKQTGVEEYARSDLDMVKQDEVFVQIIDKNERKIKK